MSTLQLTFTLRTSPNCKTCHLVGNWDNYKGQLPLSKDSSKSGAWKGTFRFQGSSLRQGNRYWYYYICDGYHVSHDPAQPHTTEPTTGRKLNVLDVPCNSSGGGGGSKPSLSLSTSSRVSKSSSSPYETRRISPGSASSGSSSLATGRSLSPSKIVSPRPRKPNETRHITEARYSGHSPSEIDKLTRRLASTHVSSSSFSEDSSSCDESSSEIESDVSSSLPSLSSGSSRSSPNSLRSPASPAGSACSCERWGVDRHGYKVRIDCGGSRCGSGCSSGSDFSSGSDSEEGSGQYKTKVVGSRGLPDRRGGESKRHATVVREPKRSGRGSVGSSGSGSSGRRYRR